jgi:hypothetical protein
MKRIHIISIILHICFKFDISILILKSVRTTVEVAAERAVKDVLPVDEAGFKATVPLVVDESFVHALPLSRVKLRLKFFHLFHFLRVIYKYG